ncbi:MAG: hypothetical protein IH889_02580, partial [Planctomycetes bacterium]|nr:hypothetical protein [Planctomycetota bacterium]
MVFGFSVVSVVVGLVGLSAWAMLLRPVVLRVPDRPPKAFPATGFDHARYESLLERFVTASGHVRYEAWHTDRQA